MARDRIEIVPYDPGWPAMFHAEDAALREALGASVTATAHVGSTAVPGLGAKPTLDLLVGVDEPTLAPSVVAGLERLGYRHLGTHGIPGREFFRKGTPPTHHVHWVRRGGEFWRSLVLFRDYLRTHPDDAARYEASKRALAARFATDRDGYTRAKAGTVSELLTRAQTWERTLPWIVFDLEATCWRAGTVPTRQEVIEFGAVELAPSAWHCGRRFSELVRPVREPSLSPFCRTLTGIAQDAVDGARPFPDVFRDFCGWLGAPPRRLLSWGEYDRVQLEIECRRRGDALPAVFDGHVDLRAVFADLRREPPGTLEAALAALGLPREGIAHRALDDALAAARVAQEVLPQLLASAGRVPSA